MWPEKEREIWTRGRGRREEDDTRGQTLTSQRSLTSRVCTTLANEARARSQIYFSIIVRLLPHAALITTRVLWLPERETSAVKGALETSFEPECPMNFLLRKRRYANRYARHGSLMASTRFRECSRFSHASFFFFFEKSRQSLYFQIEIFKNACVSRVYLENFRKDLLVLSYSYLSDNYTTLMWIYRIERSIL